MPPAPEWIVTDGDAARCDIVCASATQDGIVLGFGAKAAHGAATQAVLHTSIHIPPATGRNLHDLLTRLIRDAEAAPLGLSPRRIG